MKILWFSADGSLLCSRPGSQGNDNVVSFGIGPFRQAAQLENGTKRYDTQYVAVLMGQMWLASKNREKKEIFIAMELT